MNNNHPIEKTLSEAAAATPLIPVSRDNVRSWVVEEQSRSQKRDVRNSVTVVLVFLILSTGLGVSMNHQAQQIRELVEKNPARSVSELEEITLEVCQVPPASYFVHQLSNHKPIHRSVSLAAR
jgi:cytoskeletal protein RodZ